MSGYCCPACHGPAWGDDCPCGPSDNGGFEAALEGGHRWWVDGDGRRREILAREFLDHDLPVPRGAR